MSHSLADHDWLVMVRIQKTATKTFLANLRTIHDRIGKPYCRNTPWCCTSVPEYSPGNRVRPCNDVLASFYSTHPACRTLTEPHSDYRDITEPLTQRGVRFSTIFLIRDPVRRVVSEYKHLSGGVNKPRKNWDYTPVDYEPKTWSNFLAYLRDEGNAPGMRNRQTRMVAGCGSGNRCSDIYDTEEEMLEAAIQHLREASFVGITDHMEETLDLLWREFDLERPSSEPQHKTDTYDGRDMFAIEDPSIILEYNRLDMYLFREAERMFEKRIMMHDRAAN